MINSTEWADLKKKLHFYTYLCLPLLQVLCELQMAMLERGISAGEDVSRNIMSQEVRNTEDSSYRSLRDWYIYRDYMNGLEYVIHAFDHLKKRHY